MVNFLYVDNSNVWIEGKRVAAVEQGFAPDLAFAIDNRIIDNRWSYDFGRLLEFAGGERSDVGRAVLYGSRPPRNDTLWQVAEANGYEVKIFDRSFHTNREKKVDAQICVDITRDALKHLSEGDEITLVAGDADYVPVAELAAEEGWPFHVVFWDHAATELRQKATTFTSLNPYLRHLSLA